jgi:DNA-binding MarR family transcriptional regulator
MFSTNPASGTHSFSAYLDWSIGLHRSGLRDVQIHVLGTLVEALEITGSLAMGETTVQMSRWEIAQRTGLSVQQVQRALAALVDAGYIVRAQLEKKDGEISRTMLTAKAVEAMGLKGGANLAGDVPPELVALFIGESRACVEAIVSAWNDGRLVDAAAGHAFRGGAKAWAQIDFLLAARMEARQQALQQAQELRTPHRRRNSARSTR